MWAADAVGGGGGGGGGGGAEPGGGGGVCFGGGGDLGVDGTERGSTETIRQEN